MDGYKGFVDYFAKETNDKFKELKEENARKFSSLEKKVDELLSFKEKVFGAAIITSALISVIVTIGVAFIQRG